MNVAYKLMLSKLVEGCVKNDRNSQRKLYEYFYGKMMGVCLRYTGSKEEAAEALNTSFFKVFKNIKKFNSNDGALEAWIRRIVINSSIDMYRKKMRQQRTIDIETARYEPDQELAYHELAAEDILKMVQRLSPSYRTVFNLYAIEGYKHHEIAKILGISEGTSKSNLAKARVKLKMFLKEMNKIKKESYA